MVRRTRYAFFCLEDGGVLDVSRLVRGELPEPAVEAYVLALAILTGECHVLSRRELDVLLAVPADRWVQERGQDLSTLAALLEKGLLLSDARDERRHAALRERDEALAANEWNGYAALYHFMTQWRSVDIRAGDEDDERLAERTRIAARAFVAEHGSPPGPFATPRPGQTISLPWIAPDSELYRTLAGRQTTRAFDVDREMKLDQLATVLTAVFGCHGTAGTSAGVVCLKRTSPSGGALHPIEAYPIVSNVAGVTAGIHHYNVADHSLTLLAELEPPEARGLATAFMCGQSYFGAAHVSFVLSARFYRNHWKYRRHQKAYAGIMMDAAHLSQTLYLVSEQLQLGAFLTIAINGRNIEERLGLDGVEEGVIAMTGCGPRVADRSPLELRFAPREPVRSPGERVGAV
jgi:putative peptide maturation dehydrogenase